LCVQGLVQESFDNSIFNFVSAFTGGKKLSKEDADELRKLI
ncbi:MAG: BlaI/MecI/CopY family transcriptional regulator, partial [Lachnospiraceae bacterium]|nr:BlaI/MecI/CopY family transcriptional regulator [Lachnospiraceae bacterium]